jgi:hypothetical protein
LLLSGCTRDKPAGQQAFEEYCAGCHSETKVMNLLRHRQPSNPRGWLHGFLQRHAPGPPETQVQIADYLATKVETQ